MALPTQITQDVLLQAFKASMSNNQSLINQATEFLIQASEQKSYLPSLMLIIVNKDIDFTLRQAAAAQLKNTIESKWRFNKIDVEDCQIFKQNALEAIIKVSDAKLLHVHLEFAIWKAGTYDFPAKWGDIFPDILNKLKTSNDFAVIKGCLLAFLNLMRVYQSELAEDRKPLNEMVNHRFEILEVFVEKLLVHYDEPASAIALRLILKIFFTAVDLGLPPYFKDGSKLQKWMTFFKAICDSQVPPEAEIAPKTEEEARSRNKIVYWHNKKTCGKILSKFILKYGNEMWVNADEVDFARDIESRYLVPFLETFVKVLLSRKTKFVASNYTYYAAKFCFYALKVPTLFERLNPLLEELLFDVYLPMIFINEKDIATWKNDPIEYVRRQDNQPNKAKDLRTQGIDNIEVICLKKSPSGKRYLFTFMEFVGYVLSNGVNPRTNEKTDLVMKQSLLYVLDKIRNQIERVDEIHSQMEVLLERYVIPEFKSDVGFLRATACQLFGTFGGDLEFTKQANIQAAIEGVYQCLVDKELPVRVAAASNLHFLLPQSVAKDLLRPHINSLTTEWPLQWLSCRERIKEIIQIYLKVMDEVDFEDTVTALEGIVGNFQEEVTPFALDLIVRLKDAFFAYNDNDDEENEEAELSASGCLCTIKKLLGAKLSQEAYHKALDIMLPILNYTLSEQGCDYIDDGLGCLNSLLFNHLTTEQSL